jgi:hypothetical protein
MDQSVGLRAVDRNREAKNLIAFIVQSVAGARAVDNPFHHLEFERVFPDAIYSLMLAALPDTADYRPMSGGRRIDAREDGTPTRVKIDLFPEYIRNLPADKRPVWDLVGRALCSPEVQAAFVRRLAPQLKRRFREGRTDLYPVPALTRDRPGYRILPHTDTFWKGITVQLYLAHDDTNANIGTVFHGRPADGTLTRTQIGFAPNTGYAFVVTDASWHSVDPVGPEVETRDSILLSYFVDTGLLRFVRNRGKRVGNFLLNELRQIAG